jgi:hypothetical protein
MVTARNTKSALCFAFTGMVLAGCASSTPAPQTSTDALLPGATVETPKAPDAPGNMGTSAETVSGLTSKECLARLNAGKIEPEACLEPGI